MESRYSHCAETQNQEKYICLNKECYTKRKLHCHECLVKTHKTDKNSIRHFDQFVTIDSIMNDLQRRNNKKLDQFNLLLLDAHQFKKVKFQELCSMKSFSSKSSEFQNQIYQKIEQLTEEVSKQLQTHVGLVRQGLQFSKEKLPFLIEQYLSNDTKYEEMLKQAYQNMTQKVESYIGTIELQEISGKKVIQQLQKKVLELESKGPQTTTYGQTHIVNTVIVLALFYLIYTMQELSYKIIKLETQLIQQKEESRLALSQLTQQFEKGFAIQQENENLLIKQVTDQKSSLINVQEALISQELKFNHKLNQLNKKQDEEFLRLNQTLMSQRTLFGQELLNILEQVKPLQMDLRNTLDFVNSPEKEVLFRDYSEIIEANYIRDRLIIGQQLPFRKIKLVYSSNRDGLTKKAFWDKVTNQGPTLLIARFHNNYIVGAFSNARWMALRIGDYMKDPLGISYLFSYNKDQIFMVKDANYTIYSRNMVGPQFGQGPDLSLQGDEFDQCSSNLGNTYDRTGVEDRVRHLMDASPKIIEMEVFVLY